MKKNNFSPFTMPRAQITFLAFCLAALPQFSHAGTSAPETDASGNKILVSVGNYCGYCGRRYNFSDSCTIDEAGRVEITNHRTREFKHSQKANSFPLATETLQTLKELISEAKETPPTGKVVNYAGDAPSFIIRIEPKSENRAILEHYSHGALTRKSPAARKLARLSSRICGLEKKRMKWKLFPFTP